MDRPLPCLYTRYLLLYLSTCSASEFVCSHLYACQSISYASGFAFIRCSPRPLAFCSISPTRQILSSKNHKWLLCKIWLTGYILNTHLSVYTAGSRGQELFFCTLRRACHLRRCHYQPHYNDIGNNCFAAIRREACQQRMGFELFLTKKTTLKPSVKSLFTEPKGVSRNPSSNTDCLYKWQVM